MLKTIYRKCMKYKRYFIPLNILLIIIYACQMFIPYIFSDFIDAIISENSLEVVKEPMILITVLSIILLLSSYIKHILSELTTSKVSNNFIMEVDRKLEHLPLKETAKQNPAYLNNRIFNDVLVSVGFAINNLTVAIIMFVSTLILFYLIASINIIVLGIVVLSLIINIFGIIVLNKLLYKRGYEYRDLNSVYLSSNHDRLASIKETKIHSWYDISSLEVDNSFIKLLKKGISLNKVIAVLDNIGILTKNITLILTMIIGGKLLVDQSITIGELILITTFANMCLSNSEKFLRLGQEYQFAKVSYSRIDEFMSQDEEENGKNILKNINKVKVNDLSFSYPDSDPLYKDLNLEFVKGKVYCLKGKNGDGKSTLIDLLLGLNHDYLGKISYNNTEISEIDMKELRKEKISVILQEPTLQRISVKDNTLRGINTYSYENMNKLCEEFNMTDLMKSLDALSLSGGEKQKVSVIRGLLKHSDLLILDEPVSAMDTHGIKILKKELLSKKEDRIIIFISHNEELFDIVDEFIDLSNWNEDVIKEIK